MSGGGPYPRKDHCPATQLGDGVFVEGYWFNANLAATTCQYPMPLEVEQATYDEVPKAEWRTRFREVLANLDVVCTTERYMGASRSRLTGEKIGNVEYTIVHKGTETWKFPEGLAHYYLDNRVLPSERFAEVIDATHAQLAPSVIK